MVVELLLMDELTFGIWDMFLYELEPILLKYSTSCIMSDATVSLVPISTGENSALSFESKVVDLCMLLLVGVGEKAKSFDLRVVCWVFLRSKVFSYRLAFALFFRLVGWEVPLMIILCVLLHKNFGS